MREPEAYLGGTFVPLSQARIPLYDTGFMLGATVSEQLRTFSGRIFRLEEHLARLSRSLAIVGIELPRAACDLAGIAEELVGRNYRLVEEGDDLGLSMFVTPGPYSTLAGRDARPGPTVGLHTYSLPFHLWRDKYESGERLVTPQVRQVPPECWPAELKCRSRVHYYLADQQARQIEPGARALMTDGGGCVLETSTSNLLAYREGEGLVSPPLRSILPGISLAVTLELAAAAGIARRERELSIDDVRTAQEAMLTSTPNCLLPATHLNGAAIGGGMPGPIYRRLLAAWNELAGLDIVEQARRFASRA
ncbi:MAG: aminotransferase class IV [Planctomycetia bacterium]|nr:aminotransferase class IV [Planctomycetia bacterium]